MRLSFDMELARMKDTVKATNEMLEQAQMKSLEAEFAKRNQSANANKEAELEELLKAKDTELQCMTRKCKELEERLQEATLS